VPAVHLKGSDVSEAYKDVVARFLGEDRPMRFTDAEKPGFFKRRFRREVSDDVISLVLPR
jgi:septum site-determining protein MinD